MPVSQVPANAVSAACRQDRIVGILQNIIHDLSGMETSEMDPNATFLEMGFESLFLTQASAAFQNELGVEISFRQLFEDTPSVDSLAAYVDSKLPPEALAAASAPVLATPAPGAQQTVLTSQPPQQQLQQQALTALLGSALPVQGRQSIIQENALEQIAVGLEALVGILRGGEVVPQQLPASVAPPQVSAAAAPANVATASSVAPKAVEKKASQPATEKKPATKSFGPWKPIEKGAGGKLTVRQQKHLNALMERFTARTRESKRLAQQHRERLADPRTVAGFRLAWKEMVYPIVASRAAGSKIWDVDGNEWLDITQGFGINLFGHSPSFVVEAVQQQLKENMAIGPQTPLAGKVADLIHELTGMERVAFCNTGSEAVLAALRLTRTVSGRNRIATFSGAYHGVFDEVLVRGITVNGQRRSMPVAPGIPPRMVEDVLVLDYGDAESLNVIEQHAKELAAVLVEPIQSRNPTLQPREFLHSLRDLTKKLGIPLIFDEMITGFRLHHRGAQGWFDVDADLAAYGKVIAGGMPIGVVAGKAKYMDALDGGMWKFGDASVPEVGVTWFAGTFVRHPLSLAAAYASLKHLKEQGAQLQQQLNEKTSSFVSELNDYFEKNSYPIRIVHFASLFLIHFEGDQEYAALFWHHLRDKGIHTHEGRPNFLTTAHTNEDMAHLVRAFKESAMEMRKGGFLSEPSTVSDLLTLQPKDLNQEVRVPLTDGQKEIWAAVQMGKEASCAFNESNNIHFNGTFDVDAMQRSIQELVDRHEALRTSFENTGEYQKIAPDAKIHIPFLDLSCMDEEQKARSLKNVVREHVEKPFDMHNPPLLRTTIIRMNQKHHILVFTYHHSVCDGWSMRVILNELAKLYSVTAQGTTHELPGPMQYRQYVSWQAEQQQSPQYAKTEAFWFTQFTGSIPVLDLPTDRPRPALRTYNAALKRKTFQASVLPSLQKVGARRGSTLFSTLFAAFKVFLYRLSNESETIVGIPTAGQSLIGGADLIGHCVNFLAMRDCIDGSRSFGDYVSSTKRLVLDALEHQNYTFLRLLSKLSLRRDFSRLPLIEAAFNLDRKVDPPRFFDVEVEVIYNPKKYLNFDLFFNFVQTEKDLMLECFYNTDLFQMETIERWLVHFETLLSQIITNPDCKIDEIPVLSDLEQRKLLVEWNDTRTNYPKFKCIHQLFEAQAEETPDNIALLFEAHQLTYRQVNSRANQIAHCLKRLGVQPEVLVGVCYERSLEMVIAILGILKAGAVYLPLDPAYPQERLDYLLRDAKAPVLITQKKFKKYFPDYRGKILCLDSERHVFEKESTTNVSTPIEAENLAYVMYTSGSTGKPKGVAVTHRNVVRLVKETNYAHFLPDDVFLQFAPISFDAATFEIWGALLNGARLVIFAPHVPSLHELAQSIQRNRVTTLWLSAGLFHQMAENHVEAFQGIRQLLAGGDVLSISSVQRVLQSQAPTVLINGYGPTENTTFTCCNRMNSGSSISFSVPIGRPIANTQVYILDNHLQPVPIGVVGELYTGGDGLARGYRNRPELTAERFIPNPFSTRPGERLYKTGDLARYRSDGNIEFMGRHDFQIKIRGYRVELGEIETVLSEHPSVRESVLQAVHDNIEKRLVAYVVPKEDTLQTDDLRIFLRKKLPEYMIPSTFILLESLPLNPHGKVDRAALPVPSHDRSDPRDTFVAPRDTLELQLTNIWERLLNLSPIGIRDNFFDIGGHSLIAIRLFSLIEKVFGKNLHLSALLHAPTIEELAKMLHDEGLSSSWSSLVPIQPRGVKPPFFAIHAGGGHVLFYRELAKRLGNDQPFYALQAQGLDGRLPRHKTVEEMAEHYLKEIQNLQPVGPYHIGGASFGGLVAYEMAFQLQAKGHEVGLIALFDTHAPGYPVPLPGTKRVHSRVYGIARRIEHHATNLMVAEWNQKLPYFLQKARKATRKFKQKMKRLPKSILRRWHTILGHELPKSLRETQDTIWEANETYVAKTYTGRVTLFRASKQPMGIYPDPTLGWSKFATNLEIHEVPGYHGGIISEPRVRVTAKVLKDCLDKEFRAAASKRWAAS